MPDLGALKPWQLCQQFEKGEISRQDVFEQLAHLVGVHTATLFLISQVAHPSSAIVRKGEGVGPRSA